MGLFDKLSNLIFEDDSQNTEKNATPKKKFSDIFFEDEDESLKKEKKKLSDIFFEDVDETPKKEKKKLSDIFFEEEKEEAPFVKEEDKTSVLDDLSSKIEYRNSELIKLRRNFKNSRS